RVAEEAVDRLRAKVDVSDAVLSENAPVSEHSPTVPLSAETLRHIEGLRIETQADYAKQKALLNRLNSLDSNDLPATILAVGVQDNQLTMLSESLSLVEQRLVGLNKELGPENSEVIKATAQQKDLREKINARTRGILMGLQAKLESMGEGICALSNAAAQAQDWAAEAQASQENKNRKSQAYLAAKRELEELLRFREVLQNKISM